MAGFRLFDGDDGDTIGLDRLLKRIPADVEPQDVTLEYAGCGSHNVEVWWCEDSTPTPPPEPTPEEARAEKVQQAEAWREKHGEDWP